MRIEKIKEMIDSMQGKELLFSFHGVRNQIDEFKGIIIDVYPCVFTVCDINSNNRIKSFSYVDILVKNLLIIGLNG